MKMEIIKGTQFQKVAPKYILVNIFLVKQNTAKLYILT